MNLHKDYKKEFNELIKIVSNEKHIPEDAVLMDYYIVYMLEKLSNSEYKDLCVFKGGTSLRLYNIEVLCCYIYIT